MNFEEHSMKPSMLRGKNREERSTLFVKVLTKEAKGACRLPKEAYLDRLYEGKGAEFSCIDFWQKR